ncbi:ejaculatory bulb-specific protein 3 [Plodia interpunctella]|uniref:ejaculatory bulb-specific protein 3 n=1 Tax=Plodia interpunctella TaxID=58824 RepID=UPI0023688522|nr:ejaculatory bulb-specific protein 3-like [Plodia interpunctella]XP_053615075.1 ejaculatory bulb-specific protein 3-like [Plodia interpunctella]XP_053615076.1 ejaculatory bulb-specific protein 3-like [Plodia interpunctella]XP_053615077.1 ejaculatory bulb-specific protein 3-like [Plodia interpunctella]
MIFFLLAALITYLFNGSVCEDSTYTTKYDGVDLDEILANERLLAGYINCLLDAGPCTPDGKELKNNLPDAIQNDCHKCTERQREGADKVMEYIIDHNPDDWIKLEEKYNSDGSYRKKYLDNKNSKKTKAAKDKSSKEKSE